MLLTHPAADLATEPDALVAFWKSIQTGRLRITVPDGADFLELEGTPDMTLEIISKTSVRKDSQILRELYWRAGVPEYWLVDARADPLRFDILRHTPQGYEETPAEDGWIASAVFGKSFQLTRQTDPLGHPQFTLLVR